MTQAKQAEALQRAGAVALRLACEGDKQAAETIRAMNARIATLQAENEQLRAQAPAVPQDALTAAMKTAVEIGIFPKYCIGEEAYLRNWGAMQQVLLAVERANGITAGGSNAD